MKILTGIQPTGLSPTLGNYIGAMKNLINLQNEGDLIVQIVDLHAITVDQNKKDLRNGIKNLAALYIASGLDPKKVKLFIQSDVSAHSELTWILACTSYNGELSRMIQFKEKSTKQGQNTTNGLFLYPLLMASDILLYDIDIVPVGIDQKQHLELTRDIAERFNNKYGNTFKVPDVKIPNVGAKIMDLQHPTKKMSKSSAQKGTIFLLDDVNSAKKKIKSAITDSDTKIYFDEENKAGISNLLTIYSILGNISIEDLEVKYEKSTYAIFKDDLANLVGDFLENLQKKYYDIVNSEELINILEDGAKFANLISQRKMAKVKEKLGLGLKK